jgi:quercetin dioxygenase-like cupin family protein
MGLGSLVVLVLSVAPFEHAKPLIQNEQVAVWEVAWPEGQTSPQWDRDTLIVFVTGGSLAVTEADGRSHVVSHQSGDVEFVPKGDMSRRRGASQQPVRTVVIQREGNSPPPLINSAGVRDAFDRPGIEKPFENEQLTAWRYTWEFGKPTPLHFHARDVVVVYLADGVLKSITPDGKSVLNPHSFGYTKFSPRGRTHYEELVQGKASAVMVELK